MLFAYAMLWISSLWKELTGRPGVHIVTTSVDNGESASPWFHISPVLKGGCKSCHGYIRYLQNQPGIQTLPVPQWACPSQLPTRGPTRSLSWSWHWKSLLEWRKKNNVCTHTYTHTQPAASWTHKAILDELRGCMSQAICVHSQLGTWVCINQSFSLKYKTIGKTPRWMVS